MSQATLSERIKKIKYLALDVDGVLTDGGLYFGEKGEGLKRFNAQDGMGLKVLIESGVDVGLITGLKSDLVRNRFGHLGVKDFYMGRFDKGNAIEELLLENDLKPDEVAYVGDDVIDLPVLEIVGLPVAVANAVASVKLASAYITRRAGGHGAVREVCELLLAGRADSITSMGVIPAHLGSKRFPGKVLADMDGEPMLVRTYRRAVQSGLDRVLVASSDQKVLELCDRYKIPREGTGQHSCGSERCAEVAERHSADIIVNIQADEPFVPPGLIDELVMLLGGNPDFEMATPVAALTEESDLQNPDVVKVVRDKGGRALYFSRAALPYNARAETSGGAWKHIGVYAFRRQALEAFAEYGPSRLEKMEGLEQLRALENGMLIATIETKADAFGVNRPDDIERAIARLKRGDL